MLNKINNLMYGSMFAMNVFIMLLGCVVEYEPITIIVLCSGLVLSLAMFLFFRKAKKVYLNSRELDELTKQKKNKIA